MTTVLTYSHLLLVDTIVKAFGSRINSNVTAGQSPAPGQIHTPFSGLRHLPPYIIFIDLSRILKSEPLKGRDCVLFIFCSPELLYCAKEDLIIAS